MIHAAVQVTGLAAQDTAIVIATAIFLTVYPAACFAADWVSKRRKEVAERRIARGERW